MNYITLDLEWNQAYAQKAIAVQKRLSCRLRGEVIQIGAVKMDADLNIIGSYRITVKPVFFKTIQKHVARLTGITQEMVSHGVPLPEASERFHRWCGEDFAFLTWGPDDIPMLKENLNAHHIGGEWLDRTYDLQRIFGQQTGAGRSQKSLEFAMEHFALEQNLPAHDALNDAYFTAMVAQKLDIPGGIAAYNEGRDELLARIVGDADGGGRGYASVEGILALPDIAQPVCPACGAPLSPLEEMLHAKGQRYSRLFACPEHGHLMLRLHPMRNFDGTFRAKYTILHATTEMEEDFHLRLRQCRAYEEQMKRRVARYNTRRAPRPAEPAEAPAQTEEAPVE